MINLTNNIALAGQAVFLTVLLFRPLYKGSESVQLCAKVLGWISALLSIPVLVTATKAGSDFDAIMRTALNVVILLDVMFVWFFIAGDIKE